MLLVFLLSHLMCIVGISDYFKCAIFCFQKVDSNNSCILKFDMFLQGHYLVSDLLGKGACFFSDLL